MLVYVIENLINGKKYVGITTAKPVTRWAAHVRLAFGGGKTALARAIRKYGPDAFAMEPMAHLLPGLDVDELRLLEREIIAQENTMVPHGYNLTSGGEGLFGRQLSEELRQRFSDTFKGRSNPHKGEPLSEGHKAKLRAAWTPDRKAANSARLCALHKGKPSPKRGVALSEEHKAALRAGHAARRARGLGHTVRPGKVLSEEHKKNIAAGLRRSGYRHPPATQARALEAAWAGSRAKKAFHAAKRGSNEMVH